ncbi:hypothetical protein [Bartonella senegalensis]|uniref:hypothetical protein n=1 Tax=Bartonella senegalensis TaxID=1468418 RepID=UPI00030E3B4F|nr:hypothetical protein [Bartonella senegalensis]
MTYFIFLSIVFSLVVAVLIFTMVAIFTIMTIIAIYYSFVKRLALLFKMARKVKKTALQRLNNCEREGEVQDLALDTAMNPLSFQNSLRLSGKEYKRIFAISCMLLILGILGYVGMFFVPLAQREAGWDGLFFLSLIPFFFWASVFVTLPVVLMFYSILNYRVRKMLEKLQQIV